MALPHQGDVELVLDRQTPYLQAHGMRQRTPRVGDHGRTDTAEHEGQETLAVLDLHHDPTVGGGNDRVRDSPHPRARLTCDQRQAPASCSRTSSRPSGWTTSSTGSSGSALDEVLGPWKPFPDIIHDSLRKALESLDLPYRRADSQVLVDAVPTWGPYPEVPEALRALASRYPLVILSNAADDQVMSNVEKLEAPFHAVFTAEQAQAYKPRFEAFDYMLNQLGCGPQDVMHVSASPRYDLMVAHDLGIKHKVHVERGAEPATPSYNFHEINLLSDLPPLLGI